MKSIFKITQQQISYSTELDLHQKSSLIQLVFKNIILHIRIDDFISLYRKISIRKYMRKFNSQIANYLNKMSK